ncbi:MAG: DNA recombination protein RmuC [Flavobacteriia bacterium]|nr:DNA recombination protein RmuC [Flavobacteriia bacterium]
MLLTVVLVLLAVSGVGIAAVFYAKSQQLSASNQTAQLQLDQLTAEKNTLSGEKEKALIEHSQSLKEVELLRQQLTYERKKQAEDEARLKEQLTAIAKDVVQQGNASIKQENQSQLELLLKPFKEKLTTFESEVRENKEKGLEQFASMESLVKALSEQHAKMNLSAQNLADALKGEQKTQGNWGELALERILEMSGLREGVEYEKQATLRDEHNQMLRPDFLIKLPENKHIVVDSKVSLTAFERYINAETDDARRQGLKDHLVSINAHVRQLGDKNYSHIEGLQTPEFVLLFIPMEASFALAIREEPDIYTKAWEKRVVIVTPSTLLATLKTIESIWKQERQNANAVTIAIEAGRLYDKFVGFIEDLKKIEKNQTDVNKNFKEAFGKLSEGSGNIVGKIEKLKTLGAKASKQIDRNLLLDDSSDTNDEIVP